MEDGPPSFPRGFSCPAVLRYLTRCYSISNTGLSPSMVELPSSFFYLLADRLYEALQPRLVETNRFGLFPFRSPLLWESLLISSPPGTEMFHFPGFATLSLCIQQRVNETLLSLGFPIRKSSSHSLLGGSSRLIAAYHVLHRLLAPRHPPVALSILILKNNYTHSLFNCQRSSKELSDVRSPPLLVEVNGVEPMTPCVQSRCSPI